MKDLKTTMHDELLMFVYKDFVWGIYLYNQEVCNQYETFGRSYE